MNNETAQLIARAELLLRRLETAIAPEPPPIDWQSSIAFRWRRKGHGAALEPVAHVHGIRLRDLHGIAEGGGVEAVELVDASHDPASFDVGRASVPSCNAATLQGG